MRGSILDGIVDIFKDQDHHTAFERFVYKHMPTDFEDFSRISFVAVHGNTVYIQGAVLTRTSPNIKGPQIVSASRCVRVEERMFRKPKLTRFIQAKYVLSPQEGPFSAERYGLPLEVNGVPVRYEPSNS